MQKTDFKFHPSKYYAVILGVTLVLSVTVVAALSLAGWMKLIFSALVAGYGFAIFRRYALLKSALSVIGVGKQSDGRWRIFTHSGMIDGGLRGDSTVTSLVSILRFDVADQRQPLACIVLKDSLGADDYRRLVTLLRMG